MKKYSLYLLGALALTSCQNDEDFSPSISGDGQKTPLLICSNLNPKTNITRAVDNKFQAGDQIQVSISHGVESTPGNSETFNQITYDGSDATIAAFVNGNPTAGVQSVNRVYNLGFPASSTPAPYRTDTEGEWYELNNPDGKPLYWEDFSQEGDITDIRGEGHGLRANFAVIFNGGEAYTNGTYSAAANTGTFTWTLPTDQNDCKNDNGSFKTDLIVAPTSNVAKYTHQADPTTAQQKLQLKFKHMMSKFTIDVIARDGFPSDYDFSQTAAGITDGLTIKNGETSGTKGLYTTCNVDSKTATLTNYDAAKAITMYKGAVSKKTVNKSVGTGTIECPMCSYEAYAVPTALLANTGDSFAELRINGNTYKIKVIDNMRDDKEEGGTGSGKWHWGTKLGTGDIFLPGVNYHLTIIVDKQPIIVEAYIKDWEKVTAGTVDKNSGVEIKFDADVVTTGVPGAVSKITANGASFDLYQSDVGNTTYLSTKTTTCTYNSTAPAKWENSPKIYWPNGTDKFRFRALGTFDETQKVVSQGTATSNLSLTQGGTDILWGTTAQHTGTEADGTTKHSYSEGDLINPRTGQVPILFYHAMSKITVNLETCAADNPAWVDLTHAKIDITNLYTGATLKLDDGTVDSESYTPNDRNGKIEGMFAANAIPDTDTPQIEDFLVVPQPITDDAKIIIYVPVDPTKDPSVSQKYTTYSLQLNKCKVQGSSTQITSWARGTHYVYTIHIEKEEIKFRALIKDWIKKNGEGTAQLDWD